MSAVPAAAGPARLQQVDALRGFALFGILVVNIGVFASPYYGSGVVDPAFGRPLDLAASWVFGLLFETKFYLLFSFLFGYSFTLQMAAAERGQAAFLPRFLRRLAGLAALGAAHAVLFYHGDILLTYAILGLLLLCCRNLEPARALRLALWLIGLASAAWAVLAGLSLLDPPGPEVAAQARADVLSALQAYRGTVGSVIGQHAKELIEYVWVVLLLVQGPYAFAMFLVGYALGRRQALEDPWRQPRALGLLLALGLLPGLAGAALCLVRAAFGGRAFLGVAGPGRGSAHVAVADHELRLRLPADAAFALGRALGMAGAGGPDGIDQLPDAVRGLRAGVHGLGRAPDGPVVAAGGRRAGAGDFPGADGGVGLVDAPSCLRAGGVVPARVDGGRLAAMAPDVGWPRRGERRT